MIEMMFPLYSHLKNWWFINQNRNRKSTPYDSYSNDDAHMRERYMNQEQKHCKGGDGRMLHTVKRFDERYNCVMWIWDYCNCPVLDKS